MDWHSHFEQIFFDTWNKAGLPADKAFKTADIVKNPFFNFNNNWVINAPNLPPGLQKYQLQSVYGFGVMVGIMLSRMLGLDKTQTKNASDWCGRFNLGISLFDYICDELGGMIGVLSLKVFEPFLDAPDSLKSSATPAEELLSKLVSGVLNDLTASMPNKKAYHKTDPLFTLLHQLFKAEHLIAKEKLSTNVNLKKIKKALYLKSAAPFRVMAEYTARMANSNDPLLIKKARAFGKAVGYCYWLIDDAKDVWIDLEAGQWNLFLQLAASEDPLIFAQSPGQFTRDRLLSIWKTANHAKQISSSTTRRLINGMYKLSPNKKEQQDALGFLSASMWQWYHS